MGCEECNGEGRRRRRRHPTAAAAGIDGICPRGPRNADCEVRTRSLEIVAAEAPAPAGGSTSIPFRCLRRRILAAADALVTCAAISHENIYYAVEF